MPFCPHCGIDIQTEETQFCPACGKPIDSLSTFTTDTPIRKGLSSHLTYTASLIKQHPILLLPELLAVFITHILGQALGRSVDYFNLSDWFYQWLGINGSTLTNIADYSDIPSTFWLLPIAIFLWLLITVGISGLFTFLTIHMAWRGSRDEPVDLQNSTGYVRSRLGKFFIAAIIANLFAVTIIMLPAALFMYSVMVVDFTGIREGLSKGFKVSMDRIGTSIGLIVIYYVSIFVIGYVPYIGTYLSFLPSVIVEIASLDLYMNYTLTV
jgi:hypothetical protein